MVFLLGFITITTSELNGNPALNGMGIEHVQGSTEGKKYDLEQYFLHYTQQ